jgi:hypothetical protein
MEEAGVLVRTLSKFCGKSGGKPYLRRFFELRDFAFFEVNLALMVPLLGLRLGESARLAALPPVRTGAVDSPREV